MDRGVKDSNLLENIDLEVLTDIIFFIKKNIFFKILSLSYSENKIPYLKYIAEKINPNNFYIQYFSLKNIIYGVKHVNSFDEQDIFRFLKYLSNIIDVIEENVEENNKQHTGEINEQHNGEINEQHNGEINEQYNEEINEQNNEDDDEIDESVVEDMQQALNVLINNFSGMFSSLSDKVNDISAQLEIMEKEIEEISAEDDSDERPEVKEDSEVLEVPKNSDNKFEIEEAELQSYQEEVEEIQDVILNIRNMLNSGYMEYLNMFKPEKMRQNNRINSEIADNQNNSNKYNKNKNKNLNNTTHNNFKVSEITPKISIDEINAFIDKIAQRFVRLSKKFRKPLILLIDDLEFSFILDEILNKSLNIVKEYNIIVELIKRIVKSFDLIFHNGDLDPKKIEPTEYSISLLLSYRKLDKSMELNYILEKIIGDKPHFELKNIEY